ncbi:MAG TPA: glycosyltransferase [Planctomycetaceae bacterium]|nr:glycosyltransferase [Planctomycetaceae bacterium]
MSDLTIIIPQHGRSDLTLACVRSLRQHEPEPHPLIIVDDGSRSEHRNAIHAAGLPHVRLIDQPHAGVTAAWNRGLAAAETAFVLLLNNDVQARGPFVARLLAPLRKSPAVATGARLRRETGLPPDVLARPPSEWFLEGWCLAARTADLRRVGGFDERMKLYFSDTDLQARLLHAHRRGSDALAAIGDLSLDHSGHQTTRRLVERRQQWRADRAAFIAKWMILNDE